jgi:hypothetical protein
MNFINTLSKMDKDHIKIIKKMGINYENYDKFNENFKDIFDILEIYKFINEKDVEKEENK